ncbi:oxidoreductase [Alcanivorax hongdengensis A-11-3]|uniref:Oxidoreductase n=1 Tax=Alcanivorax hongdengensis A-11-3 TaxID=1177179 RepID=L0WC28_9GAMM|nr:FAD-dependent oxidoreductase [Alcanivorax hongdengensis]EKF74496.1 oxidoreductase [Alcanivorax hongdengensis A-11-3]
MSDVLIVGGGIVGLLSALELTERGRQVTLVDDGQPWPASWAGGGILSPLHAWRYPQAMNRLTFDAVSRYGHLINRLAGAGLVDRSALHHCGLWVQTRDDETREALDWARDVAIEAEPATASSVMPDSPLGDGVWFPALANIRNPRLLSALRGYLLHQGVRFMTGRVDTVRRLGGRPDVLLDNGRALQSVQVLVCAGFESERLLKNMGVKLPLFAAKGEMLLYSMSPGQVPAVMLTDNGYLIPRSDGAVLVGSTLQKGDSSRYPTVAGRYRLESLAADLWPVLSRHKPDFHWAGVRPGCGRPYPYMGSVPGMPGVFAAVGHYRNGLVAAPASAELMAQLMCSQAPEIDPRPYQLSPVSS